MSTTLKSKTPTHQRQQVVCLAEVIPRGDGSFVLRPEPTALSGVTWISTTKARAILGNMPYTTFWQMLPVCGDVIVTRRKSPRRIDVSLQSLQEFQRRIQEDPEFWSKRKYPPYKKKVMERASK